MADNIELDAVQLRHEVFLILPYGVWALRLAVYHRPEQLIASGINFVVILFQLMILEQSYQTEQLELRCSDAVYKYHICFQLTNKNMFIQNISAI